MSYLLHLVLLLLFTLSIPSSSIHFSPYPHIYDANTDSYETMAFEGLSGILFLHS